MAKATKILLAAGLALAGSGALAAEPACEKPTLARIDTYAGPDGMSLSLPVMERPARCWKAIGEAELRAAGVKGKAVSADSLETKAGWQVIGQVDGREIEVGGRSKAEALSQLAALSETVPKAD